MTLSLTLVTATHSGRSCDRNTAHNSYIVLVMVPLVTEELPTVVTTTQAVTTWERGTAEDILILQYKSIQSNNVTVRLSLLRCTKVIDEVPMKITINQVPLPIL